MPKSYSNKPASFTYYSNKKYIFLFESNKNLRGFNNMLLSTKVGHKSLNFKLNGVFFLNYDYKKKQAKNSTKNNNPLSFVRASKFEIDESFAWTDTFPNEVKYLKDKISIKPTITKGQYLEKVKALKQHIQDGDIYEINYCITFEAHDVTIDPLDIYQKLNAISKAPYSALAKFDKQYIISSSPELFLSKKGNKLISKPIKGTARRGKTKEEDEQLKLSLRNSLKEQTENVMIVDVVRNDLSRIAKRGTVQVEKLFDIETYEQVHQMVSTVSCELKDNVTFEEIIEATFPMASMTGAPKIRAMELIDQYELYNRGPYSGALGYIDENGDFELSVLIRSIFYDEEKQYLSFSVGSAITALCDPEEEYEECLLKAKAMMDVLSS
ncbi:MAG: aminobenzoate synthetase [Bacteroidota bacterium]|jgi:para-aminobenzoate synthetase component 1|nr:aminobenzoate synthetase [Bacteroidota bacterium]